MIAAPAVRPQQLLCAASGWSPEPAPYITRQLRSACCDPERRLHPLQALERQHFEAVLSFRSSVSGLRPWMPFVKLQRM